MTKPNASDPRACSQAVQYAMKVHSDQRRTRAKDDPRTPHSVRHVPALLR